MDWLNVVRSVALGAGTIVLCTGGSLHAQQFSPGSTELHARMRPMGSPSAVDAFAAGQNARRTVDTSYQRVTMMQIPVDSQPMAPPSLPPQGFALPNNAQPLPNNLSSPPSGGFGLPSNGLPAPLQSTAPAGPIGLPASPQSPALPSTSLPTNSAPVPAVPRMIPSQSLPINPNVSAQPMPSNAAPIMVGPSSPVPRMSTTPGSIPQGVRGVDPPSSSDYAAIPQPQLDNAFATMDNCRNVTGPSTYRAAGFFGCNQPASYTSPVYGPPVYGPPVYGAPVTSPSTTYTPPPSQVAPAIALPPGATYSPVGMTASVPPVLPGSPGYRPLFTLGQERNPVQVGQGFWGQPVAYVPGQTLRNGLRYISF